MQDALVQHVRSRIIADVDFLVSQNFMSNADAEAIKVKLPHGTGMNAAGQQLGAQMQRLTFNDGDAARNQAPAPIPKRQVKAVWNYQQTQPDDLGFVKGDIITIEAEENQDWWRGSLNGRHGIFPSNHVERLPDSAPQAGPPLPARSTAPPMPVSTFQPHDTYSNPGYMPSQAPSYAPHGPGGFVPPPPSQQPMYAYQQPQSYSSNTWDEKRDQQQMYTPPQQQIMGVPPPPPHVSPPPAPASAPPEIPAKNKHKLAKHMGTSFAGGLGFGTGTAIASNAINAIF